MLAIYMSSGGSGKTASQILCACLAQFPRSNAQLRHRISVDSEEFALKVVEQATAEKAVICHTLVNPAARQALLCGQTRVESRDPSH